MRAAAARSGGGPPSTSTEATWPSAWTPVSVRPATARFSIEAKVSPSACRSAASIVGKPGCAAQPRNGVPSYSSVRMRRMSGEPDAVCQAFLMLY
jgi:hypothetical protein